MKKLTIALSFLFISIVGCKNETKKPSFEEMELNRIDGNKKIYDSLFTVCKVRGHLFTPVKNVPSLDTTLSLVYNTYASYYAGSMVWIGNTDTVKDVLIDTPDSSYLVRQEPSDFKKCYRCGKDIEFPKQSIYVKTLWIKNKN